MKIIIAFLLNAVISGGTAMLVSTWTDQLWLIGVAVSLVYDVLWMWRYLAEKGEHPVEILTMNGLRKDWDNILGSSVGGGWEVHLSRMDGSKRVTVGGVGSSLDAAIADAATKFGMGGRPS